MPSAMRRFSFVRFLVHNLFVFKNSSFVWWLACFLGSCGWCIHLTWALEGGAEGFLLDSVLANVDLVDGLSCRVVDSNRFGCPRNAVTLRMDQVYECLPLLVGDEHVLLNHFFLRNFTYYCFIQLFAAQINDEIKADERWSKDYNRLDCFEFKY